MEKKIISNSLKLTAVSVAASLLLISCGGGANESVIVVDVADSTAQTLTFGTAPGPLTAGGATGTVTATSSNAGGAAIVYASTTASICTVNSSTGVVTPVSAGTCTISANQAAGTNGGVTYTAAAQVTQDITVNAAAPTAQTLTFGTAPGPLTAGGATGTVTATSSNTGGAAIVYASSTASICTVDSSTGVVTPVAVGTCTISANQAGGTNGGVTYTAASQVTQDITVNPAVQTLTFGTAPGPLTVGGATGTVTATSSNTGGAAIVYASTTTSICTVDSSTGVVTPVAVGTCTISANQAGGTNGGVTYTAALEKTQNIVVNAAGGTAQTLTLGTAPGPLTVGGATGTVTATSSNTGGAAIVYASTTTSICTVDSSTGVVTPVAAGTCTISANQAGGSNGGVTYNAASEVTQDITVNAGFSPDTVSCAPAAPVAGHVVTQKVQTRNNAFGMPRGLGVSAPNNASLVDRPEVTATYTFAAATGTDIALTTTATGGNAAKGGSAETPADSAWTGFVPLPVPASGVPNVQTGAHTTYTFDASGNLTSAPVIPAETEAVQKDDSLTPVQGIYPADWREKFAREAVGKAAGTALTEQKVVLRQVGGFLNGYDYSNRNGGIKYGGVYGTTYMNAQYTVKATLEAVDSTEASFTATDGKQYNKMCKISYEFVRETFTDRAWVLSGFTLIPTGPGTTGLLTATTDPLGTFDTTAETVVVTAATANGASLTCNANCVAQGITNSFGDWQGTFYTHDQIPVIVKDDMLSIKNVSGSPLETGGTGTAGTPAQPNAAYYENKDRSGASDTTSSYTKQRTTDFVSP